MRAALVILALALVAVVGGRAHAQILSPGPLHQGHAGIDTDQDCGRCHESGQKVVARLCFDCHKELAASVSASRGLHGRDYKGKACETCHVEHLGRNAKLVRWPGGAMEKLDHRQTGWALEQSHAKVKCLDCHKKTSTIGKPTFVGASTACASCHKDPHAGKFASDCQRCHSLTEWKTFEKKAFDHKLARYALTGKHTEVACEKCHTGTPPTWKPLTFATCDSCHQDPHKGEFKKQACTACHSTANWEVAPEAIKGNHPWLSLANGHARLACKGCHDKGNDKPPSKGRACEGCHKPVHLAKFGNRCESCHAAIKWTGLPEAVGRAHHDQTRYPLQQKHQTLDCAACHPKSKPAPQRWKNLAFDKCASAGCHGDKHAGEFAARAGGECTQCHTLAGFAPTTFSAADHATTAYQLDGRHLATPCRGCHKQPAPRLDWRVPSRACADCHQNPHGEQFAAEMTKGGCATCHETVDWHRPHIDHTTWPLVDAHARTACTACHGEQKPGAQPAAYRGIPRACEGCHDDVHAAQFTQTQPAKACTACHDVKTFKIAKTFDHAKQTRYPLEGKHVGLACAKCHAPTTLRDATTAVRWRLGYTACKDCHANPHKETP